MITFDKKVVSLSQDKYVLEDDRLLQKNGIAPPALCFAEEVEIR